MKDELKWQRQLLPSPSAGTTPSSRTKNIFSARSVMIAATTTRARPTMTRTPPAATTITLARATSITTTPPRTLTTNLILKPTYPEPFGLLVFLSAITLTKEVTIVGAKEARRAEEARQTVPRATKADVRVVPMSQNQQVPTQPSS